MNTLEKLIYLNRNFIINSKFQNTIYKDKTMCEILGEKSNTKKQGDDFNLLILRMIDKLPLISYENVMKYRFVYEKYPHLYLRFIGEHNYLVQIQTFLKHIDKYADEKEIPVTFYSPSFFSRSHKIVFLNRETGEKTIKVFPLRCGMWNNYKAYTTILYLIHNKSYAEILENIDWSEYEALKADLKD